jgi:hypothetical protein
MPNRFPGGDDSSPRASAQDPANIPDDVRKAIQKETLSQFSKWLVGAIGTLLVAALLGWWFYLKPILIEAVGGVPSNAIVAFDIRSKCPTGWSDFESAAGRVIVAAGKGNGLTQRDFGISGGKESITLTLDQIPAHSHNYTDWRAGSGSCSFSGCNGSGGDQPRVTEKTGGKEGVTQPFEVMPPYLVLRMCRKD